MEIVHSGGAYDAVIPTILGSVPDFAHSDEFKLLIGTAEDLPGVVAAAYARYIARLIRSRRVAVDDLVAPLNLMASWDDDRVDTMLHDEAIEQFEADGILDQVEPMFSQKLRTIVRSEYRELR
jgi:hypothetical protein